MPASPPKSTSSVRRNTANENPYSGDNKADFVINSEPGDTKLNYLQPTGDTEPVVPEGVTICVARSMLTDETLRTSGIVTHSDGNTITLQDDTAGIVVELREYDDTIRIGDEVEVIGSLSEEKELLYLKERSYRVLSAGNDQPAPKTMTLEALLANPETYESQRVRIEHAELGRMNSTGNTFLTQGKDSLPIYKIPKLTGIDSYDIVHVTAIMSQNNGYYLKVVQGADVELVEAKDLEPLPPTDVSDPISKEMETVHNAANIKEVLAHPFESEITVIGVVAFAYDAGNALIIQDIIDGQIMGYQIRNPMVDTAPGDIVVATGRHRDFSGTPGMEDISGMQVVGKATPFEPQVVTVRHLEKHWQNYLNEYVKIKEVRLPEFNPRGTISFADATGRINSYRSPAYPIGTTAGEVVHVKAAVSVLKGDLQVRLGDSHHYTVINDKMAPFIILPPLLKVKAGQDYTFTLDVIDNAGVRNVSFTATIGGRVVGPIDMTHITGHRYQGSLSGKEIYGGKRMDLAFTARDINNNTTSEIYLAPFQYGETRAHREPVEVAIYGGSARPQPAPREPRRDQDPKDGQDGSRTEPPMEAPSTPIFPAPKESTPPVTPEPEIPKAPDVELFHAFADIGPDDWYYEAVRNVVMQGLMVGTDATTFAPLKLTNRATVVTLLHRMSAAPSPWKDHTFRDVPKDAWYGTPLSWASETGITSGYDHTSFGPEDPVTREQLVAFLMKYAAYRDFSTQERTDSLPFKDLDQISPWAREAISWAVAEDILKGRPDGTLDPKGFATRAETAAMIARCQRLWEINASL